MFQSCHSSLLFLAHVPAPAGKPYQQVRRSYREATVVGWVSADDSLHLNPTDSEVVAPGSQLVFVAGVADAAVHMLETPYAVSWF